ncbi:tetratricopeptide repeat protein [Candidatus Riflebacteria bacterium]
MKRFIILLFFIILPGFLIAKDLKQVSRQLTSAKDNYQNLVKSGASKAEQKAALQKYLDLKKEYKQLSEQRKTSQTSTIKYKKVSTVEVNSSASAPGKFISNYQNFAEFDQGAVLSLLKPQKLGLWGKLRSLLFFPNSTGLYNKALKALKEGKKTEAIAFFKKSLEKDPNNFSARLALSALYKIEKKDEGRKLFQTLQTHLPESGSDSELHNNYAIFSEAVALSDGPDYDKALKLWEKLKNLGIPDEIVDARIQWIKVQKDLGPEKSKELKNIWQREKDGQRYQALQQYRRFLKQIEGKTKGKDATELLKKRIKTLEELADSKFAQVLREKTNEYMAANVRFKIGGNDTIETYKEKMQQGARAGLHSDEYFSKYVDPKTWNFRSRNAQKEFLKIAGIDCAGFLQRNWQYLYKKAGVSYPINTEVKMSGGMLFKKDFIETLPITKSDPFPPSGIKTGDIIRLGKHGDGNWNHFFFFDHVDKSGRVIIRDMSSKGVGYRVMPDWYRPYLVSWARYKDSDRIREIVGLA